MSAQQVLDQPAQRAGDFNRDGQVRGRAAQRTSEIPAVLTKQDLANLLQYSLPQIDRYRRSRTHPAILQLDGPGHPRFSGAAVRRWLDGGSPAPLRRPLISLARGK